MDNDKKYALVVLTIFMTVIARHQFREKTLQGLLYITRPGATILVLGSIAFLFYNNLIFTGLTLALVSVFLLKDVWTTWVRSDARRLYLEEARDQARFDPRTSVDIQWGNGTAVHDPANYIGTDVQNSPLLLFPPSAETLSEMCG